MEVFIALTVPVLTSRSCFIAKVVELLFLSRATVEEWNLRAIFRKK